ncbi:hypothetical protein AXX12_11275 [Anaerosporomusa subterranea]|uniref:Branched-chain amino acid ABC transporter permease n=1 Tax=Anaerosporomusa subterranea TaxID=1794912 RepID=A0A154BPJ3_ANASB|nr:branched-chain amino acid ABC transporter permease [Anaerosporomusa subterranea]KYZ75780.1 hypothetical protein AXX12_11275 [Anaerosporomusa subterranea]
MQKLKSNWLWVLLAFFAVLPVVLTNNYYIYVFNRGFANAIAVIGLVILFGIAGQISLGHVAFFALSAYTSSILAIRLEWSPFITIPLGVLFSCIWGALLSIPSFKLSGPFLSISTVAFGEVVRLLVINLEPLTNGPYGLYNIPPVVIGGFRIVKELHWYYILLVAMCLLAVLGLRIKNSYIGRALAAIREDEIAAEIMGINIRRMKTFAFVSAAFFAGLSGGLYAHFAGYLSPEIITGEQSFNLFSMAIVGGQESIIGSLWSGIALTIAPEYMRFLQEYYIMIFSLIVLLVVLLPWDTLIEKAESGSKREVKAVEYRS